METEPNGLNDTYAKYRDSSDEDDIDPSMTREEYNSEDENSPKKRVPIHDSVVNKNHGRMNPQTLFRPPNFHEINLADLEGPDGSRNVLGALKSHESKKTSLASKFMKGMSKGINKF